MSIYFENNLVIEGKELTKKYIESLNYEEREALIDPILNELRRIGFIYPNDERKVRKEYNRLCNAKIDTRKSEVFNNSNVGTYICKYFCKSFFKTSEMRRGEKTPDMVDLFNNDEVLKEVIRNRLGLKWYKQKGENDVEAFCISPRQIVQGFRSGRLVLPTSLFKPDIARFIYEKYTKQNDIVYDYSMGFGGRLLGAMASKRYYIGVDPLTCPELKEMADFFKWENYEIYDKCSEDFTLPENSVDLAFSSPPYYNQEAYDVSERQAYIKGEDYFYNIYWKNTLKNIKSMLKPNKIFAVNVKNFPKMLDMAKEVFEFKEKIELRTIRSHLTKTAGTEKIEGIYIFSNEK